MTLSTPFMMKIVHCRPTVSINPSQGGVTVSLGQISWGKLDDEGVQEAPGQEQLTASSCRPEHPVGDFWGCGFETELVSQGGRNLILKGFMFAYFYYGIADCSRIADLSHLKFKDRDVLQERRCLAEVVRPIRITRLRTRFCLGAGWPRHPYFRSKGSCI